MCESSCPAALRSEWRLLSWRLLRRNREKVPSISARPARAKSAVEPKIKMRPPMLVSYRTLARRSIQKADKRAH